MAPPSGSIPPELPPTVEEAYRRKCIELKQRLNEVEAANDAQRLRIDRARRSVYKMRLERAFLLEQLAKRTSTNVEDSEGSPSPPPTPKEKPLRTKRGHRKPDFLATELGEGRAGSHFIQQGPATLSPASEAFSHTQTTHTHPDPLRNSTPQAQNIAPKRSLATNGTYAVASSTSSLVPSQARRPKNVFEYYCNETRPILESEHQNEIAEDKFNMEGVLATGWSSLDSDKKEQFTQRFEQIKKAADLEKESSVPAGATAPVAVGGETKNAAEVDEDTEMADDTGTPGGVAEVGGFTAVNRT
ncbi:putative HMG box-containing protein C10F6.08c [Rhexocercosporidium sp. MPI-PUGE-AT-0058]|nr:putative HMG box-containing protein C10F6.08c [Rhexocercosporidium sp. MPI-PUGE-AT-0058]